MIDYIEASTFVGKDTKISLQHLKLVAEYFDTGWKKYSLGGCREMEVSYQEESGWLKLCGSVMYFVQGHNFTFDETTFVEAIDYMGRLLKVNLWGMLVDEVEFGVIMETTLTPKSYIMHHQPSKGLKVFDWKNNGLLRKWIDQLVELKMYDAGRNIQHKQGLTMKGIIEGVGWNPSGNYTKFEVHYKKPEIVLNHGVGIKLADLLNPTWKETFKSDLLRQYKRLIPMKTINTPKDKKEFTTTDIFARELAEQYINDGRSIEDLKKGMYERINTSPLLSKSDQDARKRQVKATLDKLEESDESEWDLQGLMVEALAEDEQTH